MNLPVHIQAYSDRQSSNKIWFFARDRGDCPIREFMLELDDRTFAASAQLFDRTEQSGPPRNTERFRHLGGDVYELKVHRAVAVRFLAFKADPGWIVCVAQRKTKPRVLHRTMAEVQRLYDEYERAD